MITTNQIILRLLLAIILSGIIGIERESLKRPAGFRTHILVCVGSTLVMLVGLYIFHTSKMETDLDPARLGAQVISGIGFLGAGTIIREGSSVKGLTTAAGLWAVACIGLAVGAGLYTGAILSTVFVFITLLLFKRVGAHIQARRNYINYKIVSINEPGQLGKIGSTIGKFGANITSIELDGDDEEIVNINILTRLPDKSIKIQLLEELKNIEGVLEVSQSIK